MTHFDALAPEYDRLRPAGDGWNQLAERELALARSQAGPDALISLRL